MESAFKGRNKIQCAAAKSLLLNPHTISGHSINLARVCFPFVEGHTPNRIPTKIFPFTSLAVLPNPNIIELIHGLLDQLWIVGEDASLEVAGAIAFHADACAGEVGAADISHLTVEDQNLGLRWPSGLYWQC